jgi:hypothetical protein
MNWGEKDFPMPPDLTKPTKPTPPITSRVFQKRTVPRIK